MSRIATQNASAVTIPPHDVLSVHACCASRRARLRQNKTQIAAKNTSHGYIHGCFAKSGPLVGLRNKKAPPMHPSQHTMLSRWHLRCLVLWVSVAAHKAIFVLPEPRVRPHRNWAKVNLVSEKLLLFLGQKRTRSPSPYQRQAEETKKLSRPLPASPPPHRKTRPLI